VLRPGLVDVDELEAARALELHDLDCAHGAASYA
jgi:hypothetical protein